MSGLGRFSLVWNQCGGNGLAERFYVPGYNGFLPFFISGSELTAMEKGEKIELHERALLEGILYGLNEFDNDPKPWHRNEDRHTLTYLLDVLRNGFNFESPEKLLLDCAYNLRERNGSRGSRIVLLNGIELVPFSSKIRSDLICDTWIVAAQDDDLELLKPIPEWAMETTLSELIDGAKEVVCYYGLCAMALVEKDSDEIAAYLNDFVYPNVEMRALKIKIKDLLENPSGYSIKDLEIT